MGIYIHTLRKPNPRATQMGPVYKYRFSERYYWDSPGQRSREARHAERWGDLIRDGEIEGPILVTVDGDEGCEVFRQETIVPVWSDCDEIPGEFVGYLQKEGRKWSVKSLETQLLEDRQFLHGYITEHGLWDDAPWLHAQGIVGQVQAYQKVAYDHFRTPFMKNGCFHVPAQGTDGRDTYERLSAIPYHVNRAENKAAQKAA